MNKYDIIVTDTLGLEHRYYIETNKNKKEIMSDINKAWERNTGIQINYIDESLEKDKECVCTYDNKKVLSVDVKRRPEIEELIRKMNMTPVHTIYNPDIQMMNKE